jgi:hypothetical protein
MICAACGGYGEYELASDDMVVELHHCHACHGSGRVKSTFYDKRPVVDPIEHALKTLNELEKRDAKNYRSGKNRKGSRN